MKRWKNAKKAVSLLMTGTMMLTLCSCGKGKKAFELSKIAYDNTSMAYEAVEAMGSDIYEAWRLGIYEDDEMSVELLASELSLSEEDIVKGVAAFWVELGGVDSAEEVDVELANSAFSAMEDSLFSYCVSVVNEAYAANGTIEEIQGYLDEAKAKMKELSEDYSDYEHYPNLKGYYTTTNSFFDFCKNPSGSFEQVKTTINDYKNEARDYSNDLDYIFED